MVKEVFIECKGKMSVKCFNSHLCVLTIRYNCLDFINNNNNNNNNRRECGMYRKKLIPVAIETTGII
jgi:hypothetical protein